MAFEYYDTATLLAVQRKRKMPKPFWLRFFPNQINFDTDQIVFDRVNEDYRRKAPFVAPNVQGKILADEGYDTLFVKPAYLKPKHAVDIFTPFRRLAGETPVTGSLTPAQRRDAKIAELLARQDAMITMTEETMACDAVVNGVIVVEGENYPRVTVNFNRDASLNIVLSGTARWGQADADVKGDIRAARQIVNSLTAGGVVRDLIFTPAAFELFEADPVIQKLLDKNFRNGGTEVSAITDQFEDSVEYAGVLVGLNAGTALRIWIYSGKVRNEAGQLVDLVTGAKVIGVATEVFGGTRCYGAIKDGDADFRPLERFPKNWKQQEDPWQEMLMTQSAPMMVPLDPNGSFVLTVA